MKTWNLTMAALNLTATVLCVAAAFSNPIFWALVAVNARLLAWNLGSQEESVEVE